MDLVKEPLCLNQDSQLFKMQQIPHFFSTNLFEISMPLDQSSFPDSLRKMNFYRVSSKENMTQARNGTQETENQLTQKELKDIKLWKTQKKFGDFVEGTKILPCKTFLCEEKWLNYLEPSEGFQLVDLVDHIKKQDLKIGLILDFNRSTSYYNFEKIKISCPLLSHTKYKKFKLQNGAIPCDEAIKEVCELIQESVKKNEVIVAHCYNGINRTGFLICEFLCKFLGLDAETAISYFETARGHKMEHECMINELMRKYSSKN